VGDIDGDLALGRGFQPQRCAGFVDDIADQLDAYAADIVAGEIAVPETP